MHSGRGFLYGLETRPCASRHAWIGMVVLWCVAVALALGGTVWALDLATQITPGATLVTEHLQLSPDGRSAAFVTSQNILGTNPDNSPEVYHLDLTDGTTTQLTAGKPADVFCAGISSDICRVVFSCDGDLLGTNPDLSTEVYVVKRDGTQLTQLTSDPVYDSRSWGITDDGKLVVFSSEADFTGKNWDHSTEVFAIYTDGTGLVQLTDAVGESSWLAKVSADGSVIAFNSEADLTGGNPDGSREVFAVSPDGTGLRQLTDSSTAPAYCDVGSVSGDGSVIAFFADADLTGENPLNVTQIFTVNSDGTGLTQLTHAVDGVSFYPQISADGRKIAFYHGCGDLIGENPDEVPQAYRMNADGTGLEQLTQGGLPWMCSWVSSISGDGSMVGVGSYDDITGANPTNQRQAFLYQFGLGLAQVTFDAGQPSYNPSISADGSLLACASATNHTGGNPDNSMEVFIVNADGTGLTQLTDSPSRDSGTWVVLSADGSRVAFTSEADLTGGNPDHSPEVFAIDTNGTGLTQLASDLGDECWRPTISGDGSLVAFTVLNFTPSPEGDVYVVNSDGTGLTQLTSTPGEVTRSAQISRDGSAIAFYSEADLTGGNPDGSTEVFIIQSDGTGLAQLTDSLYDSYPGSFTPDGSLLTLGSYGNLIGENPANHRQVFLINADGTGLMQVTHFVDGFLLWGTEISADGSRIVFDGCGGPADTNPDTLPEAFFVNADGTDFRQLTATPSSCSLGSSLTADGSTIALYAFADLTPGWNADGSAEIFLMDLDRFFMAQTAAGSGSSASCGAVTVTFDTVTAAGATSVTLWDAPPGESPSGFSFLGQYYDITTTATHGGTITVEIQYDDTGLTLAQEESLALLHWEHEVWVDVTVPPVDTVNNIITGEVTELSPFAPAMLESPVFGGFLQPINPDGSSVFKAGRTIPVKFSLTDGSGNPITQAVCHLSLSPVSSLVMGSEEETGEAVYEDVGGTFRYDEDDDQYIYNLSTKGLDTGTWVLWVTVDGWPDFGEAVQIGLR